MVFKNVVVAIGSAVLLGVSAAQAQVQMNRMNEEERLQQIVNERFTRFTPGQDSLKKLFALPANFAALEQRPLPLGARFVGLHVVFENFQAAADWARAESRGFAGGLGAEKFEILPEGADQAVMQSYVNELWQGFREAFPAATEGLPAPILVLVDSEVDNAFVSQEKGTVNHVIVATTQLIADAGGIGQKLAITGILAHEMAHSVFLNGVKEKDHAIVGYLKIQKDVPDFKAARDRDLNAQMTQYFDALHSAGEGSDREFHSLPSPGFRQPTLNRLFGRMRTRLVGRSSECRQIDVLGQKRDDLAPVSDLNFQLEIRPEDRKSLDEVSRQLVNLLKTCAGSRQIDFALEYSMLFRVPLPTLREDGSFQKMQAAYEAAPDAFSGLQAVVEIDRQIMRDIESTVDIPNVGMYTTEQFADDVSAIVHAQLGRDPRAYNQLLGIYLEQSKAGLLDECRKTLKEGRRPALGSFQSEHHSYCYRIYNLETMKRALDQTKDVKAFADDFVKRTTQEKP